MSARGGAGQQCRREHFELRGAHDQLMLAISKREMPVRRNYPLLFKRLPVRKLGQGWLECGNRAWSKPRFFTVGRFWRVPGASLALIALNCIHGPENRNEGVLSGTGTASARGVRLAPDNRSSIASNRKGREGVIFHRLCAGIDG
jgi:hypothetical protein